MPGSWFWIILIAGVAWQVIVAIMNERAKKQQEARMREAARRRQGGDASTSSAVRTPSSASLGNTGPQATPMSRTESLAQRRQAQLDELRRRRQQQIEELRRRDQASRTPAAAPEPPRKPLAKPLRSTPEAKPQAKPSQPSTPPVTRGRVPSSTPSPRPTQAKQPPIEIEGPRQTLVDWSKKSDVASAYEQDPRDQPKQIQAIRPASPMPSSSGGPKRRGTDLAVLLGGGLKDAAALRRAVLLKEILDPPIALRS